MEPLEQLACQREAASREAGTIADYEHIKRRLKKFILTKLEVARYPLCLAHLVQNSRSRERTSCVSSQTCFTNSKATMMISPFKTDARYSEDVASHKPFF